MRSLSTIFMLISAACAFSPAALTPPRRRVIHLGDDAIQSRIHASRPLARRGAAPLGRLRQSFCVSRGDGRDFRVTALLAVSASPSPPAPAAIAASTAIARDITKTKQTPKKRIAVIMSFMAGWADYLFITKYGYFATMHTGNLMKSINAAMCGRTVDALFFLAAISSFILGSVVFRSAELSYKEKATNGLLAPIVVGCMVLADYTMWMNPSCRLVPAMLLSFSYAIVNSVGGEITGTIIWVVTGAMTRIASMIVDRFHRAAGCKKIPKEGFLMNLGVIFGFALGTAWSVFLFEMAPQLVSRGMFSIMGVTYGLLFLWVDRKEMGGWWLRRGSAPNCNVDEC